MQRKDEIMEKIRLKDGTEFYILPTSDTNKITILKGELTIDEIKSKMTEENLSEYETLSEEGNLLGIYKDKEVVSLNIIASNDDSIIFNLKDVDMVQKRIRLLEEENAKNKEIIDALVVATLEV